MEYQRGCDDVRPGMHKTLGRTFLESKQRKNQEQSSQPIYNNIDCRANFREATRIGRHRPAKTNGK